MKVVVIYKPDGTLQCLDVAPRPLKEDAAALTQAGVSQICAQANLQGPNGVIALCGSPTGMVNAFGIPEEEWEKLKAGIVGTLGFKLWAGAPLPELPWSAGCNVAEASPAQVPDVNLAAQPVLVRELIGRPLRVYKLGDAITKDWIPDRVNVVTNDKGTIEEIWFG